MSLIDLWLNMFFLFYKELVFVSIFLLLKIYWNTCKIHGSGGISLQGLEVTLLGLYDKSVVLVRNSKV